MTSSEIIDQLLEMNDKEAISDLKLLFQTADFVKFAKHNPQMNDNNAIPQISIALTRKERFSMIVISVGCGF